ncbi:type IV pilus twitching motility protein PilT [bacterium]|nr:type IV pilus twitching motility protein PilT [bacterium]
MANSLSYGLNELLRMLKAENGSDLHVTTNAPPTIRKHGKLVKTQLPPLNKIQIEYLLKNILTSDQQKRLEDNLTIDFSYTIQDCARFRVNIFYQIDGIAGVFRIIPSIVPNLKSLDLPPILGELARLHRGLILCTGPTGSGKSTTLASMINLINRERSEHIITIEDPIEFVHSHQNCIINQREIGQSARTFSDSLRSALREDPDIILIGEMRDIETISMAVTAAETGHLVFATLHTSSAPKTIDRIIDAFPTHQQSQIRVMIAESLQAVISQTLIPTVDGQGRVCACEILINTPAVSNLIREAKIFQIYSVMQTSKQDGMQTLDQALLTFLKYRKISYSEALKRAQDKKTFASSSGRFSS